MDLALCNSLDILDFHLVLIFWDYQQIVALRLLAVCALNGQIQVIFKFQIPKCIYDIEMKQKQNRNQLIETLNGGKYKKGNLTETVNVKKVT